jgi:hypothetical protein
MIGTPATGFRQQVNIELYFPFTDSILRATPATSREIFPFLRAVYATPRRGFRWTHRRISVCENKRLAAQEGIE